jgi:hypothetical protein
MVKGPTHQFQTLVGDTPFTKMFELGYDVSFDHWD